MKTKSYLLIAFILLALLGIFLIFNIVNSQRTMLAFFTEEARSFLNLIALAQENSIFAEAELEEKIIDNLLNLILYLTETNIRKESLDKIRQNFNLSSIVVYDPLDKKVVSSSGNPYGNDYDNYQSREIFKYHYFQVLNEKYIRLINRTEKFIFQVELSAEDIKKFSQEYGIAKILNQMAANPLINYVVLQDNEGIIFATPNVKIMPRIESDSSLLMAYQSGKEITRLINYGDKQVLEIVSPFIVEKEIVGLLRIGMNLDKYHQYLRSTYLQLVMVFVILFIAGIAIFIIFIRHQDFLIREQFFSHILGTIDEGILLVDENGKIKGINKMFGNITNIPESELINRQYEKIFEHDQFSVRLVQQSRTPVEEEKELFNKILKYTTYPLYTPDRKFTGTISILHDVTKIREQEKEQREKERLSFLGNLVANFAHEIKNPLNGLAIASQRLKIEFPSQNETYNHLVSAIIKEIEVMTRILNDFLAIARPQIKEKQEFDLSLLINDLSVLIKEQTEAKNVKFSALVDKNVFFMGNFDDIRRALINLLLNALEAVSTNPRSDSEIGISLKKGRKNITIKVWDNGPGIPPAALKKNI